MVVISVTTKHSEAISLSNTNNEDLDHKTSFHDHHMHVGTSMCRPHLSIVGPSSLILMIYPSKRLQATAPNRTGGIRRDRGKEEQLVGRVTHKCDVIS